MTWASAVKKIRYEAEANFVRPITPATVDWARLVTLDFETFYSTDYTLKKMSTSEYVRDPRFKAQQVGIKIGDKPTKVYGPKQMKAALAKINWSTHSLLCHNTQFDGFILHHHFGIHPAFYYDTLSMARGLHSNEIGASLNDVAEFYGKGSKIEGALEQTKGVLDWPKALFDQTAVYCAQDVDLTYAIFKEMHAKYPADEFRLIDLTMRMFCDPVLKVDIPRVEKELVRELDERKRKFYAAVNPRDWDGHVKELLKTKAERELQGEERDTLMIKRVIGSDNKFADLLRAEGVEPPVKVSPAWMKKDKAGREDETDKWTYAFAKDDLNFINIPADVEQWRGDLEPNVVADIPKIVAKQARLEDLIACRLAVKSTTNITRAERFLTAGANGMPLPVGYAYYRAHTGRFGGNNKMNMQNLTRGGELRQSILAPKGYQLAVQDSGQIEARVNAWLWDQNDLLEAFRQADTGVGSDPYCKFATLVYGRLIAKPDNLERFLGKVCVLGLGYSMGAEKFQITLAKGALGGPPIHLSLNECMRIVNMYRRANYKIVQGWSKCTSIIQDMFAGKVGSHKCIGWEYEKIWLPNGMCLKYPELRVSTNKRGWEEWSYKSGDMRKKLYGGLLCLGADTQVLTNNGWKSILYVGDNDKLWDGAEWVSHSGLVYQGTKETIDFGGVRMTPDHEVRVGDYWIEAQEANHYEATSSFEEYHRTPVWTVDSNRANRERRAQDLLVDDMQVWKLQDDGGVRLPEGEHEKLWVCNQGASVGSKIDPWNVKPPCVFSMEKHDGSLSAAYASILDALRRTRDYCLRGMDGFSDFLVRYADWLQAGVRPRPTRQFQGVLQGQLPLGDAPGKRTQHKSTSIARNADWPDTVMACVRAERHREHNTVLQTQQRVASGENVRQTGLQKQDVYDLLNAGPRHRFTVRGNDGKPFLVHNCENLVQALARIVVMDQMMEINKKFRVVMTTHDEVVAMPKIAQAETCLKHMYKCMTTAPAWCSDLPLNAEGGTAQNYSK